MIKAEKENVNKALIFIPDIGGFTGFNHHTDIIIGKEILTELLQSIIDSNFLNLKISEIEGDAILFYKYGKEPNIITILNQYENMLINFKTRLHEINLRYKSHLDLALKLIVDYGDVIEYNINGFRKIYGEVITEAHLLLKNSIKCKNYALFTEKVLCVSKFIGNEQILPKWITQKEAYIKRKDMNDLHILYYEFDIDHYNIGRLRDMSDYT